MSGRASLNHIYRSVWNKSLGAMVAVAEISSGSSGGNAQAGAAPGHISGEIGKFPSSDKHSQLSFLHRSATLMAAVQVLCGGLLASAHAQTLPANTLPTGGVAVHGSAAISNAAANKLVVTTTNGAGTSHSAGRNAAHHFCRWQFIIFHPPE